jgi:tRNA(Ile)-lysidine synthase
MEPLGPFEPAPRIAVAVSGGPDSMALVLLIGRWARARRGAAVALTVDHGLRPESAAEARQVGLWMRAHGIGHRVLRWHAGPITSRLQAKAREARYRLLTAWCRDNGVLHLALAHQRDDQAETLAFRLARGSGPDGLAAMPAVAETADVRLLRPLLDCSRERLRAFLAARGQAWIDDPSNRDPRFARVRVREALGARPQAAADLAQTAHRLGRARAVREAATASLLARAAAPYPAGFCVLDMASLRAAPRDLALRALARVLMCVGGETYPPARERLERLFDDLLGTAPDGKRRTLAGCLVTPRGPTIHVAREARGLEPAVALAAGEDVSWDRRFHLSRVQGRRPSLVVAAIGIEGWRAARGAIGAAGLRFDVGMTLPGLWDAKGLRAIPHLGYERRADAARGVRICFRPAQPLAGAVFSVV